MGMIATNAQEILNARLRGFRPADMVMVSLVGSVWVENPVVFAKPEVEYDWRWVRDLDVCVRVSDDQEWSNLVKGLALHWPAYLCVWNESGKWGARVWLIPTASDIGKPKRIWKFELDFSLWHDFQNQDFIAAKEYQPWGKHAANRRQY